MKKVLSIVLSIVMVLCMMPAMAFAGTDADFTDAASIEYTEAVDVLYAAGIIDGMPDGSFVPNGNVTREQAAKLIATVLLGEKAEKLATDVAPFSDVAVDRWSAGYIAYGVEKGILAGVGNGAFDPEGDVTALQLAKMLLIVAGYDADIEGLTGDKWGVNTSVLADDNGLFEGNDAVLYNNAASREEAALYILNTLVADMVGYEDKGTNVTLPDGTTIISGASAAKAVELKAAVEETLYDDNVQQVAEKYVAKLAVAEGASAAFMNPSTKWTYDGDPVGTYVDEAVATYTTKVKVADLYKDLGLKETKAAPLHVNGAATASRTISIAKDAADTATVGDNGIVTKVFKLANGSYRICSIIPTFAEVTVTDVAATKTVGAYTKYEIGGNTGKVFTSVVNEDKDKTTAVVTGAVEDKDMVLYYTDAVEGKLYVEAVDTVTGICSSVTSKDVATIAGQTYEKAYAGTAIVPEKKEANYYVDSYGYYLGKVAADEEIPTYALVLASEEVNVLEGTKIVKQYETVLALPDGTTATVETKDLVAAADILKLYKYTVKDDVYTLTGPVAADADRFINDSVTAIAKGESALTGSALKANADTLFVFVDYKDAKDADDKDIREIAKTVTTVTGIANIADYTGVKGFAVDTDKAPDKIADVVYITNDVKATKADKYTYITGEYTTTVDGKEYVAYVDGALTSVTIPAAKSLNKGLYSAITVSGDTVTATKVTTFEAVEKITVSGGSLLFEGEYEDDIANDTPVYVIDQEDVVVTVKTAADLTSAVKGSVHKAVNEKNEITALYIMQ